MKQAFPARALIKILKIVPKIREKPKYQPAITLELNRPPEGMQKSCWIGDKELRNR
jgi:hypothetical protein